MDSVTQLLLGASVAAAIAPARHRRAALLAGAALGTLPDLDSLPIALFTDDPVALMTWHRSFSHSLLVLPFVGWAIWAWFRSRGGRVAEAPMRWFWAIQLALVTHPLLDAFTVYGTQLLWPLPVRPVMWSSVFIIDPFYTVWLLAAVVAALFLRWRPVAQHALLAGLAMSSAYLGWSLAAKAMIERDAARALAAIGLADAPRLSVPATIHTLQWRVVAMTPDGYVEAYRSVRDAMGPMTFRAHASDREALRQARHLPAVQRLAWFNHGFMKAERRDGMLVLSDLRMGADPDYFFRFAVARADPGGGWLAVPPRQLPATREASAMLEESLRRSRERPEAASGARAGGQPAGDG
jgi:inner membrane protein